MNIHQLTRLSARLDEQLTKFDLQPDASGQYPWQVAQQQRQKRRVVAAGVGAAAIGAGAYGAKKGIDALKGRYGVESGGDALKVGAEEARQKIAAGAQQAGQKIKAAASPYVAKAQDAVGQAGQAVKTGAANVVNVAKRKAMAGKLSATRGISAKQGVGSIVKRVARAVIHAEVGPLAKRLIALEAQADEVLTQFGEAA